jgi:hypothetical protein
MKVVAPTGQTLVAAFPVQKVTELALSEHLREMRQIQVLARQMCGPAVQSSTVASPWLQRLAAYEGLAGERRA